MAGGTWWMVEALGPGGAVERSAVRARDGAAALREAAAGGSSRARLAGGGVPLREALLWLDARRPEEGWESPNQDGEFVPRRGLDAGSDPSPHAAPGEYHRSRQSAPKRGRRGGGRVSSMMAHPSVLGGADPMGFEAPPGSGADPMGHSGPGGGPL